MLTNLPRQGALALFIFTQGLKADCSNLLIDDWASQSRLTFLNYNAMIRTSGADGTMKSIVVDGVNNRVTLTPETGGGSYFYSQTGCIDIGETYGGISMRIQVPASSSFEIGLRQCGEDEDVAWTYHSTDELGWTFDGVEKLYSIPFGKFSSIDLSRSFSTIIFDSFSDPIVFGPMSLYCGDTHSEYIIPEYTPPPEPSGTTGTPTSTSSPLVIDRFDSQQVNHLGFWHGADDGMPVIWGGQSKLTIDPSQSDVFISDFSDYTFYSQVSGTCRDMTDYKDAYLHISYSGSSAFTVALLEHNSQCDETLAPYPQTWDSVEASRYASASDIYIPLSYFHINHTRVVGISLKAFYSSSPTTLSLIEIVPSVPITFPPSSVPVRAPSAPLVFACKRPNSFAFAIDDGDPAYAQRVMDIVDSESIKVTFFTVGAPLQDPTTNLSSLYAFMRDRGHQIALHSYTHPKLEGLPDYASMDWEFRNDISAVSDAFDGLHTPYFRPPFGNEGARMRQRLAMMMAGEEKEPTIVNWSVDVEDWKWGESDTPEKQLEAFQRGVDKGGNLVVMHYLYPSTMEYLGEFIRIAKATGKTLMRVDQCMMDPDAPAL